MLVDVGGIGHLKPLGIIFDFSLPAIVNVDIPLWMGHLEAIRNIIDFSLSRGSGFTLRGC